MTTKYEDDVTGEQTTDKIAMERFAIITMDNCFDEFDAHVDTVHEHPEKVAERLHEGVDAWLEDIQQEADEEVLVDG